MAKLTAAGRKKIPPSKFAGPGDSYPVDTVKRARAAKGFAAMHHSPYEKQIDRKADKVLAKARSGKARGK
jgi:hypothetical protein